MRDCTLYKIMDGPVILLLVTVLVGMVSGVGWAVCVTALVHGQAPFSLILLPLLVAGVGLIATGILACAFIARAGRICLERAGRGSPR